MSTEGDTGDPSVVFSNSRFGLVWSWFRSQGMASLPSIYFGEANDSGEKLGDAMIFENDDAAPHPSLVWTGSKYVFAWHGSNTISDDLTQIQLAQY